MIGFSVTYSPVFAFGSSSCIVNVNETGAVGHNGDIRASEHVRGVITIVSFRIRRNLDYIVDSVNAVQLKQ